MFGGVANGHSGYTTFHEEQRQSQYDLVRALPQLQLFQQFPIDYTLENINFVGNEHATVSSRPMKRSRELGPMCTQQNLHISSCQDIQNPVSTGLKLSYEDDSHNSSVTFMSENLKAVHPVTHSLANSVKMEMDRQKEFIDHYVKIQEQNIAKGIRELNQKHTALLLNTLEKQVTRKLSEKDIEIVNMNRRNMELGLKIKQLAMEAQTWHYRAKYNESVVNALKNNLQQVIAQQPLQGKEEGFGDSEVDDAASYTNINALGNPNQTFSMKPLNCKACNGKAVCVLLLPCRHLCLCKDCEALTDICPVCQATRNETVHVFMS
uniref:BOI-related E3 ubiquitin-protein ligase 1-like n=1 Tax=Erigeron canadensis TaxID=72917 RepID=UPI001CB9416A|nr:BOI-related E3 ubiquitin-protein ligase 1-like [Erigeron canadensis]XP_043617802.1 BOI-related E3 ubiquitin-protein ligase 1-like [Erigeron canadensis]